MLTQWIIDSVNLFLENCWKINRRRGKDRCENVRVDFFSLSLKYLSDIFLSCHFCFWLWPIYHELFFVGYQSHILSLSTFSIHLNFKFCLVFTILNKCFQLCHTKGWEINFLSSSLVQHKAIYEKTQRKVYFFRYHFLSQKLLLFLNILLRHFRRYLYNHGCPIVFKQLLIDTIVMFYTFLIRLFNKTFRWLLQPHSNWIKNRIVCEIVEKKNEIDNKDDKNVDSIA